MDDLELARENLRIHQIKQVRHMVKSLLLARYVVLLKRRHIGKVGATVGPPMRQSIFFRRMKPQILSHLLNGFGITKTTGYYRHRPFGTS